MIAAVWIIAVCEIIRLVQNAVQIWFYHSEKPARENAYAEFVKSLKESDAWFVKKMLEEFEAEDGSHERENVPD